MSDVQQGPGYPYPPVFGYPLQASGATNGLAIAFMVLGIVWLYWIGSILALIDGRSSSAASRAGMAIAGMAIAGIVLGWVGVGIGIVVVVVIVVHATSHNGS